MHEVQLFQKSSDNIIDNVAEHSKTSDAQGRVQLTNRTATPIDTGIGHHLRNNPSPPDGRDGLGSTYRPRRCVTSEFAEARR